MRTIVSIVTIALSLISAACAYEAPTAPTPTPHIDPTVPFSITLGSTAGSGTTADHATITAKVQGPSGTPLSGVMVTFLTTAGELDPTQAPTASDGVSHTTLVSSTGATVTAKVGTLSAHTAVGTQAANPAPPTPTPAPPPNPAPAPTPQPGTIFLNLPGTGTTGVAVSMFISAASTAGPFTWTFGDGSNVQTAAFNTSHTFVTAGTYTVTVTSSAGSASGKITISDPPAPPPHPPTPVPAYTVTLTANPSSVVVNTTGVTLTANVDQQNGAPPATSFTWDCGNGATFTTAATTQACPAYSSIGLATAKVTATGGNVSGLGTTTISITPAPAPAYLVTLTANPSSVVVNTTGVTLTANVDLQNGAPPATSFTWDCGNGATFTTATPTQVCPGPYPGSATARVTATGGTGVKVSGSGTTPISVRPPPVPTITVSCTQQASPPNTLTCIVTATLDAVPVPSTSITHVDWDWGDSVITPSSNNLGSHSYAAIGSYRISALNVIVTGTTAIGTGATTKQVQ